MLTCDKHTFNLHITGIYFLKKKKETNVIHFSFYFLRLRMVVLSYNQLKKKIQNTMATITDELNVPRISLQDIR